MNLHRQYINTYGLYNLVKGYSLGLVVLCAREGQADISIVMDMTLLRIDKVTGVRMIRILFSFVFVNIEDVVMHCHQQPRLSAC